MKGKVSYRGFTLVESLVGASIFIVLALSGYRAFGVLMDAVSASQAKIAATALANEKFEIIRNLPYTDVGIIAGLPSGKIQKIENITRDNFSFVIDTTIRSVDDTFDGTIGGAPSDTSPADYKLVDLDITCPSCKIFSPLNFTTLVAPHALETASTNGALFIQVFDADGIPVPNASLHIVNTQTNPDTIIDDITDSSGWLKIVDAPVGTNAYNITATKAGYTEDQTYPIGGEAGIDPILKDSTVVLQQVTQTNLIIDEVSTLNVSSIDSACMPLPSIGFSLTGTKIIGNPSVLKYPTQNFTTSGLGNLSIQNLEWDTYKILLTSPSFDLAGTSLPTSFSINPNEVLDLEVLAVPHIEKALLVSVVDSLGNKIDDASVRLQRGILDETKITNTGVCPTSGQVFWNGLASGTYSLTVSKAGFETYENNSLNISSSWQHQTITLEP